VYGIRPDLCTFGKGIANGFPLSALCGRREVMRLGGFVEDRDRVFLLSQTAAAQPWALAAMMAVIDVYEQVDVAAQLSSIGARLRAGVEQVVAEAGLAEHITIAGHNANMVFAARDRHLQPSQDYRTLLIQRLLLSGVIAPSLVVCAAHDPAAIDQTIDAFAAATGPYRRALEHGIATELCGRPVRPALRPRG
jgi:glutamate-1-semialdehyde 2,1-aminomutase